MKTAAQETLTTPDLAQASGSMPDVTMLQWVRALQFGDSTLPTGAFTFSHGLESAIERGVVTDAATLHSFTKTAVEQAATGDGVALLHAWRAAKAGDMQRLMEVDKVIYNRKLNEEFRTMIIRTGKKLVELADRVITPSHDSKLINEWREKVVSGEVKGTYPVCLAIIYATLDVPEQACFMVHQYSVAMAILSAALRLVKVDHVDTQIILFQLNETMERDYTIAAQRRLDDMSGYAPVVDMLAAVHVHAHVRMFMN